MADVSIRSSAGGQTVPVGESVKITGVVDGGAGQPVELQADEHPFEGGYAPAGSATTGAGGAYSFDVKPHRNTRYRAVEFSIGIQVPRATR